MTPVRVHEMQVRKLWGYRDVDLSFHRDINILIGRNGSGKTSIMHLLRHALALDLIAIAQFSFASVRLTFSDWSKPRSITRLHIDTDIEADGQFTIEVQRPGAKRVRSTVAIHDRSLGRYAGRQRYRGDIHAARMAIANEVNVVWLPVSRRLPIPEDEDDDLTSRRNRARLPLESVDHTLRELLAHLRDYRSNINLELADTFKRFEREVLQLILYDKRDRIESLRFDMPQAGDEAKLLSAFKEAGFLDTSMRERIDEHFAAARAALKRLSSTPKETAFEINDFLVLPLVRRTREMVSRAELVESKKEELLRALTTFETIANDFLEPKRVEVGRDGQISVSHPDTPESIESNFLSSGEKQILILLIQALLNEKNPVLYLADEPELSLHVSWQEKLIESLLRLGGEMQVVIATHSPDVVGKFTDNVLDLDRSNA